MNFRLKSKIELVLPGSAFGGIIKQVHHHEQ